MWFTVWVNGRAVFSTQDEEQARRRFEIQTGKRVSLFRYHGENSDLLKMKWGN